MRRTARALWLGVGLWAASATSFCLVPSSSVGLATLILAGYVGGVLLVWVAATIGVWPASGTGVGFGPELRGCFNALMLGGTIAFLSIVLTAWIAIACDAAGALTD